MFEQKTEKTEHKVGKCFEVILNQIIQLNGICMFFKRFFYFLKIFQIHRLICSIIIIGFCFLFSISWKNNAMAKNIGLIHSLVFSFFRLLRLFFRLGWRHKTENGIDWIHIHAAYTFVALNMNREVLNEQKNKLSADNNQST